MKRRTIIIWTLISTLLSLTMIFLSYFGIVRYLTLHMSSVDGFTEGYKNLPKAKKGRVVVSFAVDPHKMDRLKPMVASLLDQTVKVDQFVIVLPLGSEEQIPTHIKKIANVIPSGRDYGECTGLVPTLLKEKECDTIIIMVDPEVVYGKDFIEIMVDESEKNPDTVLTDTKETAILVKPEHYGCNVIDPKKDKYSLEWFKKQAKKAAVVNYKENFTRLG